MGLHTFILLCQSNDHALFNYTSSNDIAPDVLFFPVPTLLEKDIRS
jgi:hypothetical protein